MTTNDQNAEIAKLEEKIERKIRFKPSASKKSFHVDLEKVKELAEKIRNYEAQAHADTIR